MLSVTLNWHKHTACPPKTVLVKKDVVEEWVQVNVILLCACTHHVIYSDDSIPPVATTNTSRGTLFA